MNAPTDKIYEQLSKHLTDQEIAEGFYWPAQISPEDLKKSLEAFKQKRAEEVASRTPAQQIEIDVVTLWAQIDGYLRSKDVRDEFSFPDILRRYIRIRKLKHKEFARQTGLHVTQVSQLLSGRIDPSMKMLVRFEIHSGGWIKASQWYRLVMKKKLDILDRDTALRRRERKNVKTTASVSRKRAAKKVQTKKGKARVKRAG